MNQPRTGRAQMAVSRRRFLGGLGAAGGAVAIGGPAFLASCSSSSSKSGGGGSRGGKTVKISNWTDYMTDESHAAFEKATGIKLVYTEDINDNAEYFTKIRPNLSKGNGIGRDGFVFTDWMASRLINQIKPLWIQPFV